MTDGRSRRLLDVTAYTTLDFAPARVAGHGWDDEAVAVVDVDEREDPTSDETARGSTEAPTAVELALEVDGTAVDRLEQHATHLDLSADQARTLADDLAAAAAAVGDGSGEAVADGSGTTDAGDAAGEAAQETDQEVES